MMSNKDEKIADLERRLAITSEKLQRKGINTPKNNSLALRLISDLSAGLGIGFIIGYNLDDKLDTKPFFLLILMVLGIISGFYNFYKVQIRKKDL